MCVGRARTLDVGDVLARPVQLSSESVAVALLLHLLHQSLQVFVASFELPDVLQEAGVLLLQVPAVFAALPQQLAQLPVLAQHRIGTRLALVLPTAVAGGGGAVALAYRAQGTVRAEGGAAFHAPLGHPCARLPCLPFRAAALGVVAPARLDPSASDASGVGSLSCCSSAPMPMTSSSMPMPRRLSATPPATSHGMRGGLQGHGGGLGGGVQFAASASARTSFLAYRDERRGIPALGVDDLNVHKGRAESQELQIVSDHRGQVLIVVSVAVSIQVGGVFVPFIIS
eukprot:CAMPEP_0114240550 /NCGR_PEP_ID=MMETSP0058-20121206/9143_1 /TAXON_ID=36894 /ORGANISM="Pyramimonas parkeae, CCMP726" /LENGTH=284 /DNA_ID=CAMNT_0001352985 /DNA_START=791 /DNA_END=1650 /DNA_ORIENTATION=-